MNRMNLRAALLAIAAVAGLLFTSGIKAQEPGNLPETKAPAATEARTPDKPAPEQIDAWQKAHDEQVKNDWPWLGRFKEADLKLPPPAAGENRVVFMGDSITEGWNIEGPQGSFPGKPYINRGISGQTSPQMVLRFHQDNLAAMAEMAIGNHIRVVLCSILPAYDFPWKPGMEPAPKILALNQWIKAYAAQKGYVYVDYHSAMKDARDGLPPTLSQDGVHPLPAGYAIMAPLAEAAIAKALVTEGK